MIDILKTLFKKTSLIAQICGETMCEKCFEYSEKAAHVMEDCNRLLAENIRLRKQLEKSNAELKRIINSLSLLKEGFS